MRKYGNCTVYNKIIFKYVKIRKNIPKMIFKEYYILNNLNKAIKNLRISELFFLACHCALWRAQSKQPSAVLYK